MLVKFTWKTEIELLQSWTVMPLAHDVYASLLGEHEGSDCTFQGALVVLQKN